MPGMKRRPAKSRPSEMAGLATIKLQPRRWVFLSDDEGRPLTREQAVKIMADCLALKELGIVSSPTDSLGSLFRIARYLFRSPRPGSPAGLLGLSGRSRVWQACRLCVLRDVDGHCSDQPHDAEQQQEAASSYYYGTTSCVVTRATARTPAHWKQDNALPDQ
jgi:hypothetical protein